MHVISVEELWKNRENESLLVLDVREPHEVEQLPYNQLKSLIHIPMNEVPQRLAEIPQDKDIVVACRSGGRSAAICDFLAGQGYNPSNLIGGILAWNEFLNK